MSLFKAIVHHPYSFPATIFALVVLWFVIHIPIVQYGTEPIPIYSGYVGDEQGPINGALHILKEQSLLALRTAHNTQYGPLMSVIAVPPVLADFAHYTITTGVFDADSYKSAVIWNWTGILLNGRVIALYVGIAALLALYLISFRTVSEHPYRKWLALIPPILLALNFHFFEYATYFRHWIFVIALLLWQVYFFLRIRAHAGKDVAAWVYSTILVIASFGISYFGIFFQILWIPTVIDWIRKRNGYALRMSAAYASCVAAGAAVIIAWVPGPFLRAVGIGWGDIVQTDITEHVAEEYGNAFSFTYYTEVVGVNNIALLLALCIIVAALFRSRAVFDRIGFGSIGIAAVAYFVFFSLQSHHEPRYILPTTVLLIALAGIAFVIAEAQNVLASRFTRSLVTGLICFQVIFHGIHIVRMLHVLSPGPAELSMLRVLIPILETADRDVRVLALRDNLLAYPHTPEAYAGYAERYGFSDRGLFTTLATDARYPKGIYLLNPTYFSYFHLPAAEAPDFGAFDIVVSRHRPNEPDVPNDRDTIGVNIMGYWYPEILRERYVLFFNAPDLQAQYGTYADTF
jgi:hypothetical protein